MCGSDGVTYESVCQMNYQAAVRMDYEGECVQSNVSIEDGCKQVVDANLCPENTRTCSVLVFPVDSCCPICGTYFVLHAHLIVILNIFCLFICLFKNSSQQIGPKGLKFSVFDGGPPGVFIRNFG